MFSDKFPVMLWSAWGSQTAIVASLLQFFAKNVRNIPKILTNVQLRFASVSIERCKAQKMHYLWNVVLQKKKRMVVISFSLTIWSCDPVNLIWWCVNVKNVFQWHFCHIRLYEYIWKTASLELQKPFWHIWEVLQCFSASITSYFKEQYLGFAQL